MFKNHRISFKYAILIILVETVIALINMRHIANYQFNEFKKVGENFCTNIGYNSHWYFFLIIVSAFIIFLNYTLKNDISDIIRGNRVKYCKRNNISALKLSLFFAFSNAVSTFFVVAFFYSISYYNLELLGFVLLNGIVYTLLLYFFSQIYFVLKNISNKKLLATFITISISCIVYFVLPKYFPIGELYVYRSLYITRAYFALYINPEYVFYLGKVLSDILVMTFLAMALSFVNERTASKYEFF